MRVNNHVYLSPWSEIIGKVSTVYNSENEIIFELTFETVTIINIPKKDLIENTRIPEKNDHISVLRTDSKYTIRIIENDQKTCKYSYEENQDA